jgi:hypothetical protein
VDAQADGGFTDSGALTDVVTLAASIARSIISDVKTYDSFYSD